MERRYEVALGAVLVAAALTVGIVTGLSGSGSGAAAATPPGGGAPGPDDAPTVTLAGPTAAGATDVASPSISGSAALPSPTPSASRRCHTNDLNPTVTLVPGGPDGNGVELLNLTLTNTSGHTCTVYGYPGMKLEDANEDGQATTLTRITGGNKATLLTLLDNQSASTTVQFLPDSPSAAEPQTGPCEPTSSLLEITPPDETTQLDAQIGGGPITACQQGLLRVFPFVAGSVGPGR